MGYTHYVRRPRVLGAAPFKQVVADTRIIVGALSEYGIQIAGADGTGEPVVKSNLISLNGKHDCGHADNPAIVIPWPADDAGGVAEPGQDATAGQWFAGVTLASRVCNGSCDYETFHLPRILKPERWQEADEKGLFFDFCKTAFRPYDLAVIAILVSFKKHFGDAVKVLSDGTDQQWFDGKLLCSKLLDFGFEFEITDGELIRKSHPRMNPRPTKPTPKPTRTDVRNRRAATTCLAHHSRRKPTNQGRSGGCVIWKKEYL